MSELIKHVAEVTEDLALRRLDHAAAVLFPQYSRSRLQHWIQKGELTVDGEFKKPKYKVSEGARLQIEAIPDVSSFVAEDISINVLFEDEAVLVVNKPAGFVVHPGAGNHNGTLLNALLHYSPSLASIPRAGIVHRLDKGTSGLMVVAKTLESQNLLVQQLQSRQVQRIYEAICYGLTPTRGKIETNLGRHPYMRTKMSVQKNGKEAITNYQLIKGFKYHSHVELSLETGRTHQIRVHMQHLGYPLVGDPNYGGTYRRPPDDPDEMLASSLEHFPRQALHARTLSFEHPHSGKQVQFEADLPGDMVDLLGLLNKSLL